MDQTNELAGVAVGVQGYGVGSLCGAGILAHEGRCRELRLEGVLDATKDGAPFCPLAIHVDALCGAMAQTAMCGGKALVVGGERAGGWGGW